MVTGAGVNRCRDALESSSNNMPVSGFIRRMTAQPTLDIEALTAKGQPVNLATCQTNEIRDN